MVRCGTDNLAEPYTEETTEDKARKALNIEDFDEAIKLFTQVIQEEPEKYSLYPLLSTSYAGKAGINILDIVKEQFSGGEGLGGGGVLDSIGKYVPEDPTQTQLDDIQSAVARLEAMPAEHRKSDGEYEYSSGAAFQYSLYLGASTVMLMNKHTKRDASGSVDEERLEEMTEEEVDYIFENLDEIVASSPDSGAGEALGEGVDNLLDQIKALPGDSNKEKLLSYIAQNE